MGVTSFLKSIFTNNETQNCNLPAMTKKADTERNTERNIERNTERNSKRSSVSNVGNTGNVSNLSSDNTNNTNPKINHHNGLTPKDSSDLYKTSEQL
ncbi:MAG: hypothetical protein FD167_5152, partial [bacterium]